MSSRSGSGAPPVPNESSSKWYLYHLDSHISDSKAQILGQTSILVPNKQVPFATIVPPSNAIWTPDEKAVFFASLRRHSRYRPDLIAEEVKTKCEMEVEWYLDILELGSEVISQVDRKRQDEGMQKVRWDGLRSWRKGLAPASREISNQWIEHEDELSSIISKEIEQREKEENHIMIKRDRRHERRAMQKAIPLDESLTPYLKSKALENHQSIRSIENKWAINDFAESINSEKIFALNKLMKPDWSTWYSDRVRIPSPPPQEGSESEGGDDNAGSVSGYGMKGDPKGRIVRDQQKYEYIISIPKKERTPEERRLLSTITNRRRNREKYRIAKLLEEGLSRDEIEIAGGADAIFASREEGINTPHKVRNNGNPPQPKNDLEGSVAGLRKIGMYEYMMLTGIEVFNYELMDRIRRRLNIPFAPCNLSFPILQGIHLQLVYHLRYLIYQSLIIGEQNYSQRPEEDGKEPEITSDHVYQALNMLGLDHPLEAINHALERIFDNSDLDRENIDGVEQNPEDHEDGTTSVQDETQDEEVSAIEEQTSDKEELVNVRQPNYPVTTFPPKYQSWHLIPHFVTTDDRVDINDEEDPVMIDDLSDAATEIEDAELDSALDRMDKAHDRIYEKSLWKAFKSGEALQEEDDRGEVWATTPPTFGVDHTRKVLKSERDYATLLLSTDADRRKRKHWERMQTRYPTTRIRRLARANKRLKSSAWIIDSDSDSDGDDERDYDELDDSDVELTESENDVEDRGDNRLDNHHDEEETSADEEFESENEKDDETEEIESTNNDDNEH
ncbi:uncharacterized protein IL334_005842 [Kwoniella shivajii]|uniref:Uncharacterized protein n=1 Tax=Kwoniella shivajii TaxID=564305 RepID=A0ABZ1D495_9TREE|nr:hypothetical protein IL334_005842 [Kwoniella shivajii]